MKLFVSIAALIMVAVSWCHAFPVYTEGNVRIYLDVDQSQFAEWGKQEPPIMPGVQGGEGLPAALADFARSFEKMTGAALPTKAGDGRLPLRLNHDRALADELNYRGSRIIIASDGVTIHAATRLGLINGLYTLLDHWGCRWVLAGDIGEVIPKRDRLELPNGELVFNPSTDTVQNFAYYGRQQLNLPWLRRNRSGYDRWMSGQHYWLYALPPDNYFAEHPEYYALIGGERKPTQLCTTNPDVIRLLIDDAHKFLRDKPTALSYPMDPADNYDFCQCDNCVAIDPPGTWLSQPLRTDRVLTIANHVAEAIEKEFPDRVVALYAYQSHQQPPVNVVPRKNVRIIVTRGTFCWLHLFPTEHCTGELSAGEYEKMLTGWQKVSNGLSAYEYIPFAWTGKLPCPMYLPHAKLAKQQAQQGIRSRHEDDNDPSNISNFLNHYMSLRLMNDPSLEPEQELSDICHAMFGTAGDAMNRYYLALARFAESTHPGRPGISGGIDGYDLLFTPEMISDARSALDEALAIVPNDGADHERLKLLDLSQKYLESYLNGVWNAQAGKYGVAVAKFDDADRLIDEIHQAGYLTDAADAHRRINNGRLKTLALYFPEQYGFIRTWSLLGPFNNDKHDAIVVTDALETDPRLALRGQQQNALGETFQWQTHTSKGGFIKLQDVYEEAQQSGNMHYAYAAVYVHSAQAQRVQFRMDSFNGFRVYLNGNKVYERLGLDEDAPDKRVVPVDLPAGRSLILVKVGRTFRGAGFYWGFYFRITDMQSNPVRSIRVER